MKFNLRYIFYLLSLLLVFMMSSCESDSLIGDETGGVEEDDVNIMFRINAIGAVAPGQSLEKIEKVKSLRIIIIDEEGNLEINEKASLEADEYRVSDFSYVFTRQLNSKTKKLFLIANEESIVGIELTDYEDLPENLPLGSLSELLDKFRPGDNSQEGYNGSAFERILNRIYFKNDYSSVTNESTGETTLVADGNSIYLPYSAFYNLEKTDMGFSHLNNPFYLVPVATKIDFNFVSYRSHDTGINDILMCSVNSHNYLNAQLDESELTKTLQGKRVWWIDWLEACSRSSQTATDLEDFNSRWGWIEKYNMPVEEATIEKSLNTDNEEWILERMADKNNPDRKQFGPFYLPESQNPEYSLSFKVVDLFTDEEILLEGYEIDTLKALFRGTHVIINVELYERAMDIYAEIVPWNQKVFIGYLQQDDD